MNESTDTCWRAAAMDAALRCRGRDGTPEFVLIAALKARYPNAVVLRFDESRERTRDAFARHTSGLRDALAPALLRTDDQYHPLCGWWLARSDDGPEIEIVLAPDRYGCGEWLVAGPDVEAAKRLVDAVAADLNRVTARYLRFSQGAWSDAPEMGPEIAAVDWNAIVLAPELVDDLRRTVDAFFGQKEVFRRAGFAWRRGILLVGPPGTGKTMVCKAIAHAHPEVPFLYLRDLAERNRGDDIETIFSQARRCAPCILAIEDIDGLIHEHNRTRLLNEMDGFRNNDGLLIVATSNHPGKIDEALLRRPSRFDRVYHVSLPEAPERIEFARRLLARADAVPAGLDRDALAREIADQTEGFTPAFLKEALLSALLQCAQDGDLDDPAAFRRAALDQVDLLRRYLKKAKSPDRLGEFAPSANGADGIGFRK